MTNLSGDVVGNRDHLRNHGFLWGKDGWRLAPAFDMNPSIDKREHVLMIDGPSADPDIGLVLASAGFYGLDDARATQIVDESRAVVSSWKDRARELGVAAGDIEFTGSAFSAVDDSGGENRRAPHWRGSSRPQRLSNSDVCPA